MQSKVLAEPLFVGREQELTQLKHYIMLAKDGKGTTVFVSGEAGTGKTRLISKLDRRGCIYPVSLPSPVDLFLVTG